MTIYRLDTYWNRIQRVDFSIGTIHYATEAPFPVIRTGPEVALCFETACGIERRRTASGKAGGILMTKDPKHVSCKRCRKAAEAATTLEENEDA